MVIFAVHTAPRHLPLGLRSREWIKANTTPTTRRFLTTLYRLASPSELRAVTRFISRKHGTETLYQRCWLVLMILRISLRVECAHRESEILTVVASILAVPPAEVGCIVEAGAYKGGSSAKYSLAASLVGRPLYVFDSFEGIPAHSERHLTTIDGAPTGFAAGDYAGSLDEVRTAIDNYGDSSVCHLIRGWFADTLPHFHEPVVVGYIDVDLASSTRTSMRYLYPRLTKNGIIYSQDGHLPLVVDVLRDDDFWSQEVEVSPPPIHGLGRQKLVAIYREGADIGRPVLHSDASSSWPRKASR